MGVLRRRGRLEGRQGVGVVPDSGDDVLSQGGRRSNRVLRQRWSVMFSNSLHSEWRSGRPLLRRQLRDPIFCRVDSCPGGKILDIRSSLRLTCGHRDSRDGSARLLQQVVVDCGLRLSSRNASVATIIRCFIRDSKLVTINSRTIPRQCTLHRLESRRSSVGRSFNECLKGDLGLRRLGLSGAQALRCDVTWAHALRVYLAGPSRRRTQVNNSVLGVLGVYGLQE